MASAFTLFGELKADTKAFENSLRHAEARLKTTEKAIDSTERRAEGLGKTTAVSARGFDKLREAVGRTEDRLRQTAAAFQRGEATSKQMKSALVAAERATANFNSRLKDSHARLTDFANKQVDVAGKLRAVGDGMRAFGQSMLIGVTAPLIAFGAGAIKSAASVDALRNKLTAATGSVENANAKLAQLRALAASNAGVMTDFAANIYSFLKPMNLAENTIENFTKALGKIKLQAPDLDTSDFALNINQLFTQGFEAADLKQLIGKFPRIGELLAKQFGFKSGDINSLQEGFKRLKEQGKLSLEDFYKGLADSVNNDASLALLSDTISIRFEKMVERVKFAIAPLGEAILKAIEPILPRVIAFVESLSAAFTALSPAGQMAVIAFGAIAAAAAPVIIGLGAVASAIATLVASAATIGIVSAVIVGLGINLAPLGVAAAAVFAAWQTNFGGIRDLTIQVAESAKQSWSSAMTAIRELTAKVTAEVSKFWAENGADIMKALQTTSDFIKKTWQSVVAFWQANGENIKAVTKAVWDVVSTVVIGAVRIIANVIKGAAAIINGDWSKLWEATKAIVSTAVNAWIGILNGAIGAVVGAVKLIFLGVWALKGWVTTQAQELGANIGRGIAAGVRASAADAVASVKSLVASVVASAKSGLAIQSPSKVFHAIGQDTVQGFIDGIASLKASAQSAMASLVDVSGLKLGKFDKAGVELLTNYITEISRLNVKTKEQEVLLELSAGKYAKLNAAVRERILLAAKELDAVGRFKELANVFNSLSDAVGKPQTELEKINAILASPSNADAIARYAKSIGLAVEEFKALAQIQATVKDGSLVGDGSQGAGIFTGERTGQGFDIPTAISQLAPPPPLIVAWSNFFDTFQQRIGQIKESLPSIREAIGVNLVDSIYGIGDVFANAVARWDGTAKGFFQSLAQGFRQMVSQIIAEITRLLIIKAVTQIIGSFAGGGVPTGGHEFGHLGGFASGGFTGAGSSSAVAGLVHRNEFVMPTAAVKKFGLGFMESIKNLSMPQMSFAGGGYTGGMMSSSNTYNNQRSNVFHINVTGGGSKQDNFNTAKQIQREVVNGINKEQSRWK